MNVDLGLFILRVIAGALLLTHGVPKLLDFRGTLKWLASERFPLPVLSTIGLTAAETIGAVFLVLGIFTQWTALVLAFAMLMAVFFHLKKRHSFKQMENALLYFIVCLVLAIAGGGAWTLYG